MPDILKNSNPVPKLCWRLRALVKDHPHQALELKNAANRVIFYIKSMGLHDADPKRWEGLTPYVQAAAMLRRFTGKQWYGEAAGHDKP